MEQIILQHTNSNTTLVKVKLAQGAQLGADKNGFKYNTC